jgi:hypothetical protein
MSDRPPAPVGRFVEDDGQTWYRIDHADAMAPFFVALASDSDVWAFVSTAGSLAAGRRDAEGAFFPYETVDRIHRRGEHTGARTWVRVHGGARRELWQPFAPRLAGGGLRSVWKNLSGTCLRFTEEHASGLVFEHEWSSAAGLGLVRTARLRATGAADGPVAVDVLDGVLDLVPPGVSVAHATTMSCLADAYKWNEAAAGARLGLFTLYARIWDRAEPKESFEALVAWHAGVPPASRTLLSDHQAGAFCRGEPVQAEPLTRGRKGAFLVHFSSRVDAQGLEWHQVIDSPRSQVQVAELARRLQAGGGTPQEIRAAVAANTAGVDELLARADGLQNSADPMAAAHHRANVLFNIMRGGVFADGTEFDRDDLRAFIAQRHRPTAERLAATLDAWPPRVPRAFALDAARRAGGAAAERLVLGYLPLTFSRRHGDPSRPWNRFSIHVRDEAGRRVVNYEGNWRDIFQNWEALLASEPAYAGSMIEAFLGAMTPDGHNPYRIGRSGVDWEVPQPDNPWSHIGYWGDHPVVYLLRLLEAAQARDPVLLPSLWDRALFSFADVPYRLKPHAEQTAHPKDTIVFDEAAHAAAHARAARVGADGLMVCDAHERPVLATLGEKLATIVLAKAGTLVPGGGLWLHTQRPEWNDANNALVGNGLSIVTLAHLRRLLGFVITLPAAHGAFEIASATLTALEGLAALARATPASAADDAVARRTFVDRAGALLDTWRAQAYRGAAGRTPVRTAPGLLPALARELLPLVDATLARARRGDGLFHSYNLVDFSRPGRAELSALYPMLEGQVALLACGFLSLAEAVRVLDALFASPMYDARRRSFMLYPDRPLAGFLERNRLDAEALALPVVQALLAAGRGELLQRQSDGTVRFAPALANRGDLEAAARVHGAAGGELGTAVEPLAAAYDRLLGHHAFTGRSGTMFAYEGLGCIYWHMVAKLLLAVQERVFEASDAGAPELGALVAHYRRVRDGLGYRKTPAEWGAFPADPYSHTAGEGGAQQPGMTGQVKEEILTRWGELGVRFEAGQIRFDPVLLDVEGEVPADGALTFTLAGVRWSLRRAAATRVRTLAGGRWTEQPQARFHPQGVEAVEVELRTDPA